MPTADDAAADRVYERMVARLEGDDKRECVRTMGPADIALWEVVERNESELKECEEELQASVASYEKASRTLRSSQDGGAALTRAEVEAASKAMEVCMARRTELSVGFAAAKSRAVQHRKAVQRDLLQRFGTPADRVAAEEEKAPAPAQLDADADADGDGDAGADADADATPLAAAPAAAASPSPAAQPRYEALQASHADLVIRIGGSLSSIGIRLDDAGVVVAAPGGLFDSDYTVLGIDSVPYSRGLEEVPGTHNVVLRCRNEQLLSSLARVPPKQLKGKSLKLLQVQVSPDDNGFGIDLSEFNGVADLVQGGAAARSELKRGDVIVAADGTNIGTRRLVEVLTRGQPAYIFTVVRPAQPSASDKVVEAKPSAAASFASGVQAAAIAMSAASRPTARAPPPPAPAAPAAPPALTSAPPAAAPVAAPVAAPAPARAAPAAEAAAAEAAPPKPSATVSAGDGSAPIDQQAREDALSCRIVRVEPNGGTGITVEWALRLAGGDASHYQLEWRMVHEAEWTNSAASRSLKATVVTKGNLVKDRPYVFRVRACGDDGACGAWADESVAVCPDGRSPVISEELSTIAEERSDMMSACSTQPGRQGASVAPSAPSVAPSAPSVAPSAASAAGGAAGGLSAEALKAHTTSLLRDQREALEAQHRLELARAEAEVAAAQEEVGAARVEVEAAVGEAADWKEQFLAAAGKTMQAVLDAKEEARSEVRSELAAEMEAAEALKAEAQDSLERVRAAEEVAEAARAGAAEYRARFDFAKAEAKEATDAEANAKVNLVMRNAAIEMRDKVRAVENQIDETVRRAVDEAHRGAEAKAEASRRAALREAEIEHERQLQAMRDKVSAGAKHRVAEVEARQEARVRVAVEAATVEAREMAAKAARAETAAAVAEAVAKTEARLSGRQGTLEQQLWAREKELETKIAAAADETDVRELVNRVKEEAARSQAEAVRAAVAQAEQRAAARMSQVADAVSEKVAAAVAARERELLADQGRTLRDLAAADLQEHGGLMRTSAKAATQAWGGGNDEFEEAALSRTRPSTLLGADELLLPPPKPPPDDGGDGMDDVMLAPPPRKPAGGGRAGEEAAAAPREPKGAGGGKRRARRTDEDDEPAAAAAPARRTAASEDLQARELDQALALGASLAYERRAAEAAGGEGGGGGGGDGGDALGGVASVEGDEELKKLAASDPKVKRALDRVIDVEGALRGLAKPSEEAARLLTKEKRSHERTTRRLQNVLRKAEDDGGTVVSDGGTLIDGISAGVALTDEEREGLDDALAQLQAHRGQGQAMQAMLQDVASGGADAATEETASTIGDQLGRDEETAAQLARQLTRLLGREETGRLREEDVVFLRRLLDELGKHREQAAEREAHVAFLRAEGRKARVAQLKEARAELARLQAKASAMEGPVLPAPPVAAAEDGHSIAVDWLPPLHGEAKHYHLQWRPQGEAWVSTKASEAISVPCCTKGQLKTKLAYQFRVRACDKAGKWGKWSKPSEATAPSTQLRGFPSRPKVRVHGKVTNRIDARWAAPTDAAAPVGEYELQWRLADGHWGEEGCSCAVPPPAEAAPATATTPGLVAGAAYVFRVRAVLKAAQGRGEWTGFSPPSAPIRALGMEGAGKAKGGGKGTRKPKAGGKAQGDGRAEDADDSETVIGASLEAETAAAHPSVRKAVGERLEAVKEQRAADEAAMAEMEERHARAAAQGRGAQLSELASLKGEVSREMKELRQQRAAEPRQRVSMDEDDEGGVGGAVAGGEGEGGGPAAPGEGGDDGGVEGGDDGAVEGAGAGVGVVGEGMDDGGGESARPLRSTHADLD